jgi:hypothetical protein
LVVRGRIDLAARITQWYVRNAWGVTVLESIYGEIDQ